MVYNPTVWETGDIVTAEKLNKIELGIANSGELRVLTVPFDGKGFIKGFGLPTSTYYTYEELTAIVGENLMEVYAYDARQTGSRGLCKIIRQGGGLMAQCVTFEAPSADSTSILMTTSVASLNSSNVFTFEEHVWHFDITNDD